MPARILSALVALLAVLVAVGDASADVIGGDPGRCPRGAIAVGYSHGGPRCAPAPACTRDRDCASGRICEWSALCVESETVLATCSPGDACPRGSCERARRCAERAP